MTASPAARFILWVVRAGRDIACEHLYWTLGEEVTKQSKGQKAAQTNVDDGSGVFEVRTNQPSQGLSKGDKIKAIEYLRKNKND